MMLVVHCMAGKQLGQAAVLAALQRQGQPGQETLALAYHYFNLQWRSDDAHLAKVHNTFLARAVRVPAWPCMQYQIKATHDRCSFAALLRNATLAATLGIGDLGCQSALKLC